MPLTKFVRNVQDLSDDGGFKFRFKCDRCGDGFESQYIASKSNVLKTAIDMFQVFNPVAGRISSVSQSIGRGLQGKEHDASYERAVNEASAFFKKCSTCGNWVCPENCWNENYGMCDECAPESDQAAAKEASKLACEKAVQDIDAGRIEAHSINCPVCGAKTLGGKFCEACGASLDVSPACAQCKAPLPVGAKFCGRCGTKA